MSMDARKSRDRRRAPRRRAADDPVALDPAIAEFREFLDERLGRLEQAAAIAAGEIEMETGRMNGLASGDGRKLSEFATSLAGSTAATAEDFSRLRAKLHIDQPADNGPSQGLELIIRQMAVAGATPVEIEQRLARLGIEHSREAVGQIFGASQH